MTDIALDLESFAVVKGGRRFRRGHWRGDDPRWVQQLNNIRLSPNPQVCAALTVEHGLPFEHCSFWDSYWNPDLSRVEKSVGKKTCYLKLDVLQLDERENLHCDNGPALVSGSHQFYFLHGHYIDEPKWVMTPAEKLDPREVLQIRSVDLRRELMRKIGVEQFLSHLFSRVVDQQGNYTLLEVLLGDNVNSACRYLKMLNPSIGVWHMEGVPNDTRTVEAALSWRNHGWFVNAEAIT